MTNDEIRTMALSHGFTLRSQPGGEMDLNPYVYALCQEIFEAGWDAAISAAADRCEAICHKYMRGDGRKSDAADECKDAVRRLYREAPDCDGGGHAGQQERDEAESLRRDAELWRAIASQDLKASGYGKSAPFIHPGTMTPIARKCWVLTGDDAAGEVARTLIKQTQSGVES